MLIPVLLGAALPLLAGPQSLPTPIAQGAVVASADLPQVPPEAAPQVQPLTELLVLDPVGRAVRGPLQADPVAGMIARGAAPRPQEGTQLAVGDGRTRTWRRLESAEGSYSDPALRGGWAYARVTREPAGVYLLEAVGHADAWVDGQPRGGDVYGLGIVRTPIVVPPGGASVLFKGGRGELQAALSTPPAPVFLEARDATLPDVVRGSQEDLLCGVVVVNASAQPQSGLMVQMSVEQPGGEVVIGSQRITDLLPLEIRKQAVRVPLRASPPEGLEQMQLVLRLMHVAPQPGATPTMVHEARYALRVRDPQQTQVHAIQSNIDESVQLYALVPRSAEAEAGTPPGLVLSLHGAAVEARSQAENLTPREWAYSVAPTNRRPYGFDWEDWGRQDALEVLFHAGAKLGVDPRRVALSGHSMGGHGTWLLGAQQPGVFAAIAPSAGWRDFWSYSGAWKPEDGNALQELFARAANVSKLDLVLPNLLRRGVYVLHGDADDNVPVEEARAMRASLAQFHPDFAYHEQPGAGHWWGSQCIDWPELYGFLERRPAPADAQVLELDFTTVNPAVSSRLHWMHLEAQHHSLEASSINARLLPDRRRFILKTQNVSRLLIDLSQLGFPQGTTPATLPAEQEFSVFIDGQEIGIDWPPGARELRLLQRLPGGDWAPIGPVAPRWKSPLRAGPFKEAMRNRMVFVYSTGGTPEENAWSLAKARYDLEQWRYRGNGSAPLVSDQQYMALPAPTRKGRSVVLYGNADANTAWAALPADCPILVRRGLVKIGERSLNRDDLACIFTFPLDSGVNESAVVVCGSGLSGARVTDPLPYFRSGAHYPDWTVLTPEVFAAGAEGVLGTGFFGYDWTLDRGDSAWHPSVLEANK